MKHIICYMFIVNLSGVIVCYHSKLIQKNVDLFLYIVWLNCRIPHHLFASHRITKVPLVLCLILQSILTHVNEVVRSGGGGILQLLPLYIYRDSVEAEISCFHDYVQDILALNLLYCLKIGIKNCQK